MIVKNLYYSDRFNKTLLKLSPREKRLVKNRLSTFLRNPFDSRLKTHKLSGKLKNYWSFSINYHLRILFEFIDQESVGLVDIGTHEIYR